jgi:hypothetical protein
VRAVLVLGRRVVCAVGRVVLALSLVDLFFLNCGRVAVSLLLRYRCVAVIVAYA